MNDTATNLDVFVDGESAKLQQVHASAILARYGPMRAELEALQKALESTSTQLADLLEGARDALDPFWKEFIFSRVDLSELSFFKFLHSLGSMLLSQIETSARRASQMGICGTLLLPAFHGKISVGDLMQANQAGADLLSLAAEEFQETYIGFDKVLGNIYVATKAEYKRLRRKYLGEASKQNDVMDEFEENMLTQFFGGRPKPPEVPLGPGTALIDDNCVLTQLLSDLSDALPKEYERTVPIMKGGLVTGKTKVIRQLDPGEVEECALTMMVAGHPHYREYVLTPDHLIGDVMSYLVRFHIIYQPLAGALERLTAKASTNKAFQKQMRQRGMCNPVAIQRQYKRINFLAIQPALEDVAPRTRVERDFAEAREKLFRYLLETYNALAGMDFTKDATEEYAKVRVTEAIQLRKEMDEVVKSEHQKNLARNIRDDNEFYTGKTMQHGALELERTEAPATTYADVVGESFGRAKEHIEAVIHVASHPHVMRLSAPRGDVRSNLLLIGPYGCGKSYLARAVCADKRIIGVNISAADLLTAYMHESVKNIKRLYEECKDLRRKSRHSKPVGIVLDEFDQLFSYGEGVNAAYDGRRMQAVFQEMMDGVVGYEGVFMVAMTNVPSVIPKAILRRFKFVDVVGQLNEAERGKLFADLLTRGLPVNVEVGEKEYEIWARMLINAPGDVIGKVADEIHGRYMDEYVAHRAKQLAATERALAKRMREREANAADRKLLKNAFASYRAVTPEEITAALDSVLRQPQVQMQIAAAREVYRDAKDILEGLSKVGESGLGFGAGRKTRLWE